MNPRSVEKEVKKKRRVYIVYTGIVVDTGGILHSCVEAITRAEVSFLCRLYSRKLFREEKTFRGKKRNHFSTTMKYSRQRIVSRTPRLPFSPLVLFFHMAFLSSFSVAAVLEKTSFLVLSGCNLCSTSPEGRYFRTFVGE